MTTRQGGFDWLDPGATCTIKNIGTNTEGGRVTVSLGRQRKPRRKSGVNRGGTLQVNFLPVWDGSVGVLTPRLTAATPLIFLFFTSCPQLNELTGGLNPGRTPGGKPLGSGFLPTPAPFLPAGENGPGAYR